MTYIVIQSLVAYRCPCGRRVRRRAPELPTEGGRKADCDIGQGDERVGNSTVGTPVKSVSGVRIPNFVAKVRLKYENIGPSA